MRFIDRHEELARLERVTGRKRPAFVVLYGRRRVGKTRLLLEWCERARGVYSVADQSSAHVQRRYLAEAIQEHLPGFADVEYRDWRLLLSRFAKEAKAERLGGPLVLDELPYLVETSPELPSVLQRWVDHEGRDAGLVLAVAGSSQRMMQGLVLSHDAPLYGRACESLDLQPLAPRFLREVFDTVDERGRVELYTAWGGIPWYWELAEEQGPSIAESIERLVLDPMGPLHREPDRLLIEELPPAMETRPLLDAIGGGAHRVSEIAGRIGRPATALSRSLARLVEMCLVRREVPFGEPERKSRRALYRIADPFTRLWFRVVAPNRALLAAADREVRLTLLGRAWPALVAETWEDLCRTTLPTMAPGSPLGRLGPWKPASRWWWRHHPEWDIVAESLDGERLLLGEAKAHLAPADGPALDRDLRALERKHPPLLDSRYSGHDIVRALFVPTLAASSPSRGPLVVTADQLM